MRPKRGLCFGFSPSTGLADSTGQWFSGCCKSKIAGSVIVDHDADVAGAAHNVALGKMENAGQLCLIA